MLNLVFELLLIHLFFIPTRYSRVTSDIEFFLLTYVIFIIPVFINSFNRKFYHMAQTKYSW